jgi:hypothetical protein
LTTYTHSARIHIEFLRIRKGEAMKAQILSLYWDLTLEDGFWAFRLVRGEAKNFFLPLVKDVHLTQQRYTYYDTQDYPYYLGIDNLYPDYIIGLRGAQMLFQDVTIPEIDSFDLIRTKTKGTDLLIPRRNNENAVLTFSHEESSSKICYHPSSTVGMIKMKELYGGKLIYFICMMRDGDRLCLFLDDKFAVYVCDKGQVRRLVITNVEFQLLKESWRRSG